MTNDLTGAMPAGLAQYRKDSFNDRFKVDVSDPFGRISTDMKRFTFYYKDKSLPIVSRKNQTPATFMDFCIIDGNPVASRTYWEAIKPKPGARPDCASLRGDVPDASSPKPQSKTCAACKNNVFGSGLDGKSKRCGSAYRIAVLPALDFNNEAWGGCMQFRLTPGTWKNWDKYCKEQEELGRDLNLIVTRFRFDPEAQFQKFLFSFQRWIDPEEEAPWVAHWSASEACERIVRASETAIHVDEVVEPEAEEEEAAAPTISAAEKMAAARTAAKTRAAPEPVAAPFVTDEEEEEDEAPVSLAPPAKTNVVPIAAKPPVTAKAVPPPTNKGKVVTPVAKPNGKAAAGPIKPPVAPPEAAPDPQPVDAEEKLNAILDKLETMDAKHPMYARLMKQAQDLSAIVTAEVIEGEVLDDDEADEASSTGMASTADLLNALDDDLDPAGIPG